MLVIAILEMGTEGGLVMKLDINAFVKCISFLQKKEAK